MDIGIIVYSHTGHTLSVALKLKEILSKKTHNVTLERLQTRVPLTMTALTAELKTIPNIESYDAVILGTPVRGGEPSPPMKAFLEQIDSFDGKMVAILVTGFFPFDWGRKQTIVSLETICRSKDAELCGSVSVRWLNLKRKRQITKVLDSVSGFF